MIPIRILIVGAGSIGMLFAAKLSGKVDCIQLLTNTDQQKLEIAQQGLWIVSSDDGKRVNPLVSTFTEAVQVPMKNPAVDTQVLTNHQKDEMEEWIFLTVKQRHITSSFVDQLSSLMNKHTKLLCFQNGIGHVERLMQRIPADQIFLAVTTEGSRRISDTQVLHTGCGTTYIGQPLRSSISSSSTAQGSAAHLVQVLQSAGFDSEWDPAIEERVWEKLMINAVINPLTAILRIPNGHLLSNEYYLDAMKAIYDECVQLTDHMEIKISADLWERIQEICRNTFENHSSMLQDLERGDRSEIDWITGSMIRLAESKQLNFPLNRMVYQLVKGMEVKQ